MIAFALSSISAIGQDADTICLLRTQVIDQINQHAACDSAVVVMGSLLGVRDARITELEESRSELMMQIDLHNRVRVSIESELEVRKEAEEMAKKQATLARMWTRVTVAIAVVAEVATVYLLVR